MGGGEVPPGFPQPNPTESYWQLPPHPISDFRSTPSLPENTLDYVIIGSGITGAAVAYKLLTRQPSLSILMLEARTAASGASGRNGGHCRSGWWLNFKKYCEAIGEEDTVKFERLEEQNVADIAAFVKEHDVQCDFKDVETADTYSSQAAWEEVLEVLQLREEFKTKRPDLELPSVERRVWYGEEASKHVGLPGLAGAVTYPGHTQNPYLLVCKMLELGIGKGLNLQTKTMAYQIKPVPSSHGSGARWEVHTDRGSVVAEQVVLATNAYTNALHRGIASTEFLTPARSQVTALRPRHYALDRFTGSYGINDRGYGDYFFIRSRGLKGEGDVLYGGGRIIEKELGNTDDSKVNGEIAAYLKRAAPEVIGRESWGPSSDEVRDWTGITCYTPDTFPLVGEVPDESGLWASVGMNGHGMAMAFRSAEALVTMMTTGEEPDWFPKAFRISRAWKKNKEDLHSSVLVD